MGRLRGYNQQEGSDFSPTLIRDQFDTLQQLRSFIYDFRGRRQRRKRLDHRSHYSSSGAESQTTRLHRTMAMAWVGTRRLEPRRPGYVLLVDPERHRQRTAGCCCGANWGFPRRPNRLHGRPSGLRRLSPKHDLHMGIVPIRRPSGDRVLASPRLQAVDPITSGCLGLPRCFSVIQTTQAWTI